MSGFGRPRPGRVVLWALVAVVALASALVLRQRLPEAVEAVAAGDRGVAFALGLVPWLALVLSVLLLRLLRHWWPMPVAFWLWVVMAPRLTRRSGSGGVEDELVLRAPGYPDGWAAGVLLLLVPLLAYAAVDRARRRRADGSGR